MKIALLVEGPSDEKTLKNIVPKILGESTSIVTRVLRGRCNLLNERKIRAVILNDILSTHPDVSKIIICVDFECTPEKEAKEEAERTEKYVRSGIHHPLYYIPVIHALEGWLLADPEKIKMYLGTHSSVKIPPSATLDCKPKEVMKDIFRQNGREFVPPRDNPRIAEKIDIDKMAANNRSFQCFKNRLEEI
jgi:hypothetical protein